MLIERGRRWVPLLLSMQLLKVKEAAEVARHANGEFLANLSHEARKSIDNIIGMTDAALARELKPEQARDLSAIKHAVKSLLSIMDNALDYFEIAER
jgi:signal transduction histidine kinase